MAVKTLQALELEGRKIAAGQVLNSLPPASELALVRRGKAVTVEVNEKPKARRGRPKKEG